MGVRHTVRQGDRWQLVAEFQDNDGAAVDQSGFTFACQWRTDASSDTVAAEADVDDSDAANGIITFTVDGTQTRDLTAGVTYEFDAERFTTQDVDSDTFYSGTVLVLQDVTRPVTP